MRRPTSKQDLSALGSLVRWPGALLLCLAARGFGPDFPLRNLLRLAGTVAVPKVPLPWYTTGNRIAQSRQHPEGSGRHYLQLAEACWRLYVYSPGSRWGPWAAPHMAPQLGGVCTAIRPQSLASTASRAMSQGRNQWSIAGSSFRSHPPTRVQVTAAHPCAHVPRPGANGRLLCTLHGKPRRIQSLRLQFLRPGIPPYCFTGGRGTRTVLQLAILILSRLMFGSARARQGGQWPAAEVLVLVSLPPRRPRCRPAAALDDC